MTKQLHFDPIPAIGSFSRNSSISDASSIADPVFSFRRPSARDADACYSGCSTRSPSVDSGIVITTPKKKRSALLDFLSSTKALIRFPLHNNHELSIRKQPANSARVPIFDSPHPSALRIGTLAVNVNFNLQFESPPITLFKDPAQSTGAIFSGLLHVSLGDPHFSHLSPARGATQFHPSHYASDPFLSSRLDIRSLTIRIVRRINLYRPVNTKCPDCHLVRDTLMEITYFVPALPFGEIKNYPISHLFPGSTPQTSVSSLCEIRYFLEVDVVLAQQGRYLPPASAPIRWEKELMVQRSIVSLEDSVLPYNRITSIRKIEGTDIKIKMERPVAVYPDSTISLNMLAQNLQIDKNAPTGRPPRVVPVHAHRRWAVSKVLWKISQYTKLNKSICHRHRALIEEVTGVAKEHLTRAIIAEGCISDQWVTEESSVLDEQSGEVKQVDEAHLHTTLKLDLKVPDLAQLARKSGSPPLFSAVGYDSEFDEIGFSQTHRLEMSFIMEEELVFPDGLTSQSELTSEQDGSLARSGIRKTGRHMTIQFGVNLELTEKPLDEQMTSWDEDVAPAYCPTFSRPPEYSRNEPPAYDALVDDTSFQSVPSAPLSPRSPPAEV